VGSLEILDEATFHLEGGLVSASEGVTFTGKNTFTGHGFVVGGMKFQGNTTLGDPECHRSSCTRHIVCQGAVEIHQLGELRISGGLVSNEIAQIRGHLHLSPNNNWAFFFSPRTVIFNGTAGAPVLSGSGILGKNVLVTGNFTVISVHSERKKDSLKFTKQFLEYRSSDPTNCPGNVCGPASFSVPGDFSFVGATLNVQDVFDSNQQLDLSASTLFTIGGALDRGSASVTITLIDITADKIPPTALIVFTEHRTVANSSNYGMISYTPLVNGCRIMPQPGDTRDGWKMLQHTKPEPPHTDL